jgi:hypothetical protein
MSAPFGYGRIVFEPHTFFRDKEALPAAVTRGERVSGPIIDL